MRDEVQAVAPIIRQMWIDASNETLKRFQSLAKGECRFNAFVKFSRCRDSIRG